METTEMSGMPIRRILASVVVPVLLVGSACTGRSDNAGEGSDVDYCTAHVIFDHLREPRPEDRREVLEYASAFVRIIDRVDPRRELDVRVELRGRDGKKPKVAPAALADLKIMRASLVKLRDAVRSLPGDGEAVKAAASALSRDPDYAQADKRTTEYVTATCAVKEG